MFNFLTWVLVSWVCQLCENSNQSIHSGPCIFLYIFILLWNSYIETKKATLTISSSPCNSLPSTPSLLLLDVSYIWCCLAIITHSPKPSTIWLPPTFSSFHLAPLFFLLCFFFSHLPFKFLSLNTVWLWNLLELFYLCLLIYHPYLISPSTL